MTLLGGVVLIALVLVALVAAGALVVCVVAARQLVAPPSPALIAFSSDGATIRLPADSLTEQPGEYGLRYDDGRGHARVGRVLQDGLEGSVKRAVLSVTGSPLPVVGSGNWVRDVASTPAELGLDYHEVGIASDAGISPAWLVGTSDAEPSSTWAIHLHGIRTTRSVTLPTVVALKGLDVTSLVVSWRGDTEGPETPHGTSSLGQEEWRDVEEAIAFAVASGARAVILVGWSMGGVIARLLTERSRFRDRVIGAILISPVVSWRAVIRHAVRAARLPPFVAPGVEVVLGNRMLCRLAGLSTPVRLNSLEGDSSQADSTIPTLVIHNPGDDVVPFATVRDDAERNPESTLVVFEHGPHAMEWNKEPERFESIINAWTAALLAPKASVEERHGYSEE